MAIDPICHMQVDESTTIRAERDGATYYFCCESCRRKFLGLEPTSVPATMMVSGNGGLPVVELSPPIKRSQPRAKYFCPMCDGVESDRPGTCPKCGMALEAAPVPVSMSHTLWTCPMHPEIERDAPGSCPICGMALEPLVRKLNAVEEPDPEFQSMWRRFLAGTVVTVPLLFLAMGGMLGIPVERWISPQISQWVQLLLATPIVVWGGWPFFVRGYALSIRTGISNMFTLIGLGTGAAYVYSVLAVIAPQLFPESFRMHGVVELYFEAAAVIVVLVLLGQVLELQARRRTGSAIRELMSLVPPTARVVRQNGEVEVPLSDVRAGDVLRVRPGEKIPVDGGSDRRQELPSTNP